MSWSEELETLYKTQELSANHAVGAEVPELINKSFLNLQRSLLPKLKQTFLNHKEEQPSFEMLANQFPTTPIQTQYWGELSQAVGNLILAMHLALPFVSEPIFEEVHQDELYQDYEGITVSVGKDLLTVIQRANLPTRLQQLREKLAEMFGFPFPKVVFKDDSDLEPHAYTVSIGGNIREGLALHNKMIAISTNGQFPNVQGIECTDPIFGLPSKWIASIFEQTAKKKGCVVLSPLGVIIAHIERLLRIQYHHLLSTEVFINLIQDERDVASMFIALPKEGWLSIFRQCLRSGIPLINLPHMIDVVIDIQAEVEPEFTKNADYLYILLRLRFAPRILKDILDRGKVSILQLNEETVDTLMSQINIEDDSLSLPKTPDLLKKITEVALSTREHNPVLVCPDLLVPDLSRNLMRQGFKVPIIMDSEIPEHVHRIPVAPSID